MTSLYSLRSTPKEGEFIVMKFDSDYEVESVYALSAGLCVCPAGHKPTCRHRKMLPMFLAQHHVDDGWFLDWDTRLWRKPLGPESEMSYEHDKVALVDLSATLADYTTLPKAAALPCVAPGPGQEPDPEATPMMDTIRTLAAEEDTQPPQASPPAAPPAPPLSRVEGAGGPIKRRRITL